MVKPTGQRKTIADLRHDERNARRHTPRNIGMIAHSLQSFGAARGIVIDEDGTVLAGNGVLEAAAQAGIENVRVIETDGSEIVAVQVKHLTPEQKRQYAIADNRTTDLSEWDTEQLAAFLDEGTDLGDWFFEDELAELLNIEYEPSVGLADPDAVPEPPAEPITKPGDVWVLGEHRVCCGDATVVTDVDRLFAGAMPNLMVTDPPYGVDYDPQWRHEAAEKGLIKFSAKRDGKVENDDRVDWSEAWSLFPGNVAYVWHAGVHASEVQQSLEVCGYEIRSQIVWAKDSFSISRGHYHWQHEPCWYAVRKGTTASWEGDRSQSTLWKIAKNDGMDQGSHGTQKPLECMARPLRNHDGDVYDPFLGSGTTLIAAEIVGRRCYGMEISPAYVDVCVKRWEDYTGQTAHREPAAEAAD